MADARARKEDLNPPETEPKRQTAAGSPAEPSTPPAARLRVLPGGLPAGQQVQERAICAESGCDSHALVRASYCRAHYIKNWTRIKRKEAILRDGKLQRYISELVSRYPEKVLHGLRHDLSSAAALKLAVQEIEARLQGEGIEMPEGDALFDEIAAEAIRPGDFELDEAG